MKTEKNILVILPYGFDARKWKYLYRKGKVPDLTPYGYHHAENFGCKIEFSEDHDENFISKIFRKTLRKFLGFDLIHVKRNLEKIKNSDIIWTHTEYEFLAILFWLRKIKKKKNPKVISQIIWLADKWGNLSPLKKLLYKWLIEEADILTFHSSENLKLMDKVIPNVNKKVVLFGISMDSFPLQKPKIYDIEKRSIKILSLGNDIHRDWDVLLKAVGNKKNIELRILTYKLNKKLEKVYNNLQIYKPKNLNDIKEHYKWADLVVIPLKSNLHVSGITVLLEATTFGKPVICSDTGGLKDYFLANSVLYVPVGNAKKIYEAVIKLSKDKKLRYTMVINAQKTIKQKNLTTIGFAKRHCEISQQLTENDK